MKIKQVSECGGIPRIEYEQEQECPYEDWEIEQMKSDEIKLCINNLMNALQSADYQINNLENLIIDRKARVYFIKSFVKAAIESAQSLKQIIEEKS